MCDPARLNYCWACSKMLRNGAHTHMHIDGHDRILHKECASTPSLAAFKMAHPPGGDMYEGDCERCGLALETLRGGACLCWQSDPFGI